MDQKRRECWYEMMSTYKVFEVYSGLLFGPYRIPRNSKQSLPFEWAKIELKRVFFFLVNQVKKVKIHEVPWNRFPLVWNDYPIVNIVNQILGNRACLLHIHLIFLTSLSYSLIRVHFTIEFLGIQFKVVKLGLKERKKILFEIPWACIKKSGNKI